MSRKTQLILVTGNPVDGLTFYGPFDNVEAARRYADTVTDAGDGWWVAELNAVSK